MITSLIEWSEFMKMIHFSKGRKDLERDSGNTCTLHKKAIKSIFKTLSKNEDFWFSLNVDQYNGDNNTYIIISCKD